MLNNIQYSSFQKKKKRKKKQRKKDSIGMNYLEDTNQIWNIGVNKSTMIYEIYHLKWNNNCPCLTNPSWLRSSVFA